MSYTKTNWENLPSTNTPVNATNLNKIENELANKNLILVRMSANVTLSTGGENKIPLDTVLQQIGTGFSVSNNKVYVGEGISYVLVSGSAYANRSSSAGAAYNAYIYKNGTSVVNSTNAGASGQRNQTIPIPPYLVPVQQGDYFELGYYGYSGDVINASSGTHLMIQAVG